VNCGFPAARAEACLWACLSARAGVVRGSPEVFTGCPVFESVKLGKFHRIHYRTKRPLDVLPADGDTVTMVKDLKVKGATSALKAGTKVKNIRLVDGDHNIDCRIDGFGAMALKSEFVKKA
jgi:hypothetical protein